MNGTHILPEDSFVFDCACGSFIYIDMIVSKTMQELSVSIMYVYRYTLVVDITVIVEIICNSTIFALLQSHHWGTYIRNKDPVTFHNRSSPTDLLTTKCDKM